MAETEHEVQSKSPTEPICQSRKRRSWRSETERLNVEGDVQDVDSKEVRISKRRSRRS